MNRRSIGRIGKTHNKRDEGLQTGFTLIELLVVVAMIAIVSAIVLPVVLQAADAARKNAARQASAQPELPPPDARPAPLAPPAGPLPVLDAVVLKMALTSNYHRIGMDVYTRYQVDCTGQIVFERPEGVRQDRVALVIPFPVNTLEARDVQLTIWRPGSTTPVALTDVTYTRSGIACTCSIAPRERLTADVRFTALGREQFDYMLPPSRQLRSVSITLNLAGTESHTIPDDSLQPSATEPNQIRWEFQNLVSDRQITVLIPGAQAPLARVLLLLRLVALGVLLFGAGFWYLSEQAEPGRLDSFRLGHFLLLALTYSLFFGIFAVLGFHGKLSTPVSMLVSAACSLPLLIFHVSRILDFRFALTRVAPLALFTVGLVVNGVYGGELRDYVFLGAVIVSLAYVTLSYPAWAAGRERFRANRQATYLARCQALSRRITVDLNASMAELTGEEARASDYLSADVVAEPGARSRLERAREPIHSLVEAYGEITKSLNHLPSAPGGEALSAYESVYTDLVRKTDTFENRLAMNLANLQAELATYQASVRPAEIAPAAPVGEEIHCIACGQAVPDAPFCQKCGTAEPRVVTCTRCEHRLVIPMHLLAADKQGSRIYCPQCGASLAGALSFIGS